MTTELFADGIAAAARYHTPALREYRGNPFIEALPPTLSREDARVAMARYPEYHPEDRNADAIDREHMASLLSKVRHPVKLHLELHSRLSRLIRNGYLARNPVTPYFQPDIDAREAALQVDGKGADVRVTGTYPLRQGAPPGATGLTFLGPSGIGKSAAIDMCLQLYPQLLVHTSYAGRPFTRTQVVWLRLDVPPDGSILALAERFFTAFDGMHAALDMATDYRHQYMPARATIQQVIPRMARLAAQHGLGVLVIDEIQDLNARGERAMLSFLVQLANTVGIPVVLVGGVSAAATLSSQFRQARRGATEGDLVVSPAQNGREWRAFCEVLWRYQYTREVTPLTDDHVAALWDVSLGVTDFLVRAYQLAQVRAIASGEEYILPRTIFSIEDSLTQSRPARAALRRNHVEVLKLLGDVVLPKGFEGIPFVRADDAPKPDYLVEAEARQRARASVGPAVDARDVPPPTPADTSRRSAPTGREAPATIAATTPRLSVASVESAGPEDARRTGTEHGQGAAAAAALTPLAEVVRAAREAGVDAHSALVAHGVIADAVWHRVVGTS